MYSSVMSAYINVFVIITYACVVFGQDEIDFCTTPTDITGSCITLANCNKLKPLIRTSIESREFLKQWHCGFDGDIPKVCCPPIPAAQKSCVTLEGVVGSCIPLQACPVLALKLQYRHVKGNLAYLQKSRCLGGLQQDVCCDPEEHVDLNEELLASIFGKPSYNDSFIIVTKPKT